MLKQKIYSHRWSFSRTIPFLFGFCISGCNSCQPPTIVDVPASNVDVELIVIDVTETPSDGKVIAVMQFSQNGKTVEISSNVGLTCNGTALSWNGLTLGHAERVPLQPVGGTYVFRYLRSGVSTSASVTVPSRPVFTAPTLADAILARTNNFTIHYIPGTGTSVRGDASDGTQSKNNSQPDDGTFDGLDVSSFNAGPGTLSINRTLENTFSGTGFQSAKSHYSIGKSINITWQ